MSLKDISKIKYLEKIIFQFENIIVTTPLFFNFDCENLKKKIKKKNILIEKSYSKIKKIILKNSNKNDLILICGSLYLATDIRQTFK